MVVSGEIHSKVNDAGRTRQGKSWHTLRASVSKAIANLQDGDLHSPMQKKAEIDMINTPTHANTKGCAHEVKMKVSGRLAHYEKQ